MIRRDFLRTAGAVLAGLALPKVLFGKALRQEGGLTYAHGMVRANGRGLAYVLVSNGRDVVRTADDGSWRLPVTDGDILFVIKPTGYQVPLDPNGLPQFFYVHHPEGSPKTEYAGLAPTGPLPDEIVFDLIQQEESSTFRMVMFGDPQPRNQTEIDYMAHDVIEQCARDVAAFDAKFGISLGDIMFDNLEFYDSLNRTIGTLGLPWYNVVGNHDLNFDAPNDRLATETFKRIYGPNYYAFAYGTVTFLILDDIFWEGAEAGRYHGEFDRRQLWFVRNLLREIPEDSLVVVCMHIPIMGVENREALYRILEGRKHTLSFSAHTHVAAHHFLDAEDGWMGDRPHHHINHATVCGSWWRGAPDERGIPHATMSDGGPNGYSIVEFSGTDYKVMFRPASRPPEEQMGVWTVDPAPAGSQVVVNVWAGSERSVTQMRLDGGNWQPMERFVGQDPFYLEMKELEASPTPPPGRPLPGAANTGHLWRANLPAELTAGMHVLEVRSTDMFGQVHQSRRLVRVD